MTESATTIQPNSAEPPLALTIDIGSSSARVLLFDRQGRAVEGVSTRERYEMRTTAEGASEDDPDESLERAARCVDLALTEAGPLAKQIAAVAVTTLVSNILAIDASGAALIPLVTYADTRNDPDADALRAALDEQEVHDRTGCLLRTSYWPARLAWFRRVRPQIWQTAARWITLGEYLELRLFGRCRASLSAASWSGLLDRRTLAWDRPLLDYLGLPPDRLSPLVDVDEPLSGLLQPYAGRWPALRDVPWFPAVGDGAAANVGSGCTGYERIALTIGTTGAMRVALKEVGQVPGSGAPQVPPGLWCYRVDRDHALLGGATSEGGNVYGWLRSTLQLGTPEEVEAAVAQCPPDSHGLTILPFLAGERSPGWAGNVQATIHGLATATTPIEIVRASLEAVAYRFAVIEERIEQTAPGGPNANYRLVANGGALRKSPAWMQIFADVLGRTVVESAEPEATSRGAAVLALRSLGATPSIEALPASDGRAFHPDAERQATYREAIARQRRLYDLLIGHGA